MKADIINLNEETINEAIDWLVVRASEEGEYRSWDVDVADIAQKYDVSHIQAAYIFVRFTKYLNNKKNLTRVIDFN